MRTCVNGDALDYFDMNLLRNPGLSARLAVLVAALVVLAIGIVSMVSLRSLRDLAEAEAIVRVELAVAAGRETLRAMVEASEVAATLLAERPTLRQLMLSDEIKAASDYLRQYCSGADLDVCAVTMPDRVAVTSVPGELWPSLALEDSGDDAGRLVTAPGNTILAVGSSQLAGERFESSAVLVARRIDEQAVGDMSDQAGLELSLVTLQDPLSSADGFTELASRTLSTKSAASGRLEGSGDFGASLMINDSHGQAIALLHARLAKGVAMQPVAAIGLRILASGLIVAFLAIGIAVLVGRHWAGGVGRLTDSAKALHAGDVTTPIRQEPGKELSVLSQTMEDMRRAMAELEVARRTRDTVLANISHEFRTPLAAQLASIELLRDECGTDMGVGERELVISLERGAKRLTRLIDNLLESVRIEAGQLEIRRQKVQLAEVVADALSFVEPLLQQRGQDAEVHDLDTLPTITGDHQRLTQVFVNLLSNASKFGRENGRIWIGGQTLGDGETLVWVEDDGPGPLETAEEILFGQFRRSSGPDPEQSGLGLGLHITKSIVERHGGRVSLSRTESSRTRATVELPVGERE